MGHSAHYREHEFAIDKQFQPAAFNLQSRRMGILVQKKIQQTK
jgi:hypothetical protein